MRVPQFISQIDEAEVLAAIREVEALTSGELRVYISSRAVDDVRSAAEKVFLALGMRDTAERNAILIYIAPKSQQFAIFGDEAIHARCGQAFWEEVTAAMQEKFCAADFHGSLLLGIRRAGQLLAETFPRSADDRNELDDAITGD